MKHDVKNLKDGKELEQMSEKVIDIRKYLDDSEVQRLNYATAMACALFELNDGELNELCDLYAKRRAVSLAFNLGVARGYRAGKESYV